MGANGMGGVMNEGDLEAWVMGQQVQVGVKDVVALGPNEIVEEQMQASVDIGKHLQQMLIELWWIWKKLF
jgi:hypothetical protein